MKKKKIFFNAGKKKKNINKLTFKTESTWKISSNRSQRKAKYDEFRRGF